MLAVGGAASAKHGEEGAALVTQAENTVEVMASRDAGLRPLLNRSAGYIVFPRVGEGGFIVGGAGGKGVLFENGRVAGYAKLSKVSAGAIAGGQKFAELVVIRDQGTLARLKEGKFDVGASASAVAIRSGAAAQTQFGEKGVAVFVHSEAGAMVNLSLSGQHIKITAASE
jgi:lipid-binding SYLF domain-containing protein